MAATVHEKSTPTSFIVFKIFKKHCQKMNNNREQKMDTVDAFSIADWDDVMHVQCLKMPSHVAVKAVDVQI